eukprot:TRINITY_DN14280_c0_g3_i5.p1 TRINITY_DN14280_c0_g3~~TRINITY_DN14280_c0_g3_i5.p1  ORF type:complete len:254 (+),score=51.98 TRINITY_DN14280_c0_g3_i5:102-863(+)
MSFFHGFVKMLIGQDESEEAEANVPAAGATSAIVSRDLNLGGESAAGAPASDLCRSRSLGGPTLKVPEEGLTVVMAGSLDSEAGFITVTGMDARRQLLKVVCASAEPGAKKIAGVMGSGMIIETSDCFPIAFMSTDDVASRRCIVYSTDHNEFGVISSDGQGARCAVIRRSSEVLAGIYVDMMGKVANVTGPYGELLATVSPQAGSNAVPQGAQGARTAERCRLVRLAGGVDCDCCLVVCLVLACMKLKIGDL